MTLRPFPQAFIAINLAKQKGVPKGLSGHNHLVPGSKVPQYRIRTQPMDGAEIKDEKAGNDPQPKGLAGFLTSWPQWLVNWCRPNIRSFLGQQLPAVWVLSLVMGALVGVSAILFRLAIGAVQYPWLGTFDEDIGAAIAAIPWWLVILAPMTGGLIVGQILIRVPGGRAEGVADVIEAQALGINRLGFRKGLVSAIISALSLGSGASAGREGPVVHLGASISASLGRHFELPMASRRTILAAGVAAAVSASFNAPIAGVVFAHEVVLGHYAMSAFVPIVFASVVASVISRAYFGDYPAFILPSYQITSYWEFPAFALLGVTCAVVAIIFQFALMGTDRFAQRLPIPLWLRPVLGGFAVGLIGLAFPQVLGVGYGATDDALNQSLSLGMMLALVVMKTAATAITLASRFGGGIFSPALYLGAMTGGAFGVIAASVFPDFASSHGLYAILGMGAVAAAVLGAPFSTTLIVFELTGGFAFSIALLLAASIASGINQAIHGHSYFQWQLEMRGHFLREGPHKRIVKTIRVRDVMIPLPEDEKPANLDPDGDEVTVTAFDTLETALQAFDRAGRSRIPVVDHTAPTRIVGHAVREDALSVYNKALVEVSVEEHR